MNLAFITSNKHKVTQAIDIFKDFNINISHIDESYDEPSDDDSVTIVEKAARLLANTHNKPIFIEDTSIFFEAYKGFPGSNAKFIFNTIGYEGILKLLEDKPKKAYFLSAVAYCEPNKDPIVFTSKMYGHIITEVHDLEKNVLPYMRIFIPDGFDKPLSKLDDQEILETLHRTKAIRKLAKHLSEDKK